jgi:replicative DNA helicase
VTIAPDLIERSETDEGSPLPRTSLVPRAAHDVLLEMHQRSVDGTIDVAQPVSLGFEPLDKALGGGVRAGDLVLIGGVPGAGKTTFALQAARNIAFGGQATAIYICYEHDEEYLLARVISLESTGLRPGVSDDRQGLGYSETRSLITRGAREQGGLWRLFASQAALVPALERIERYGPRLLLQKASGIRTDVQAIRQTVYAHRERTDEPLVVVVDFLQKVPSLPEMEDEGQRVTRIVQGLKDLALSAGVAIVAIVAAEKEALDGRRLRPHHFRGSSALLYEADVILVFNSKYNIVSKTSIEYNLFKAQEFHDWIVCTIEKNRSGRNLLDLEFKKRFAYACFNPVGNLVEQQLIGDRVTT